MYTQCPECLTVFSLDVHVLVQAHGHVTCGHCGAGFDSIATLTGQLPPEPFMELVPNEQALQPPRVELAVYRPRADAPAAAAEATGEPAAAAEDFTQLVFAPRFARESRKPRRERRARPRRERHGERRWPWIVVCLVLLLLLGVQLAWAKRDALIADPHVGPWLRRSCQSLGCRLPLVQDVRQLRLVARDVQAHPSVGDALMISATVRNTAAFAQPYPVVTLVLSDAAGKRVAMRRLRPSEYLGDDALQRAGLAPGANAALLFEVEDPDGKAVAFEFGFE
ncbi:hypothetical protein ASG87_16370 [Frateuria sp. Soil773]|uniref:zinc-ribbon and DUF3426 domain-containing protein n=1 Tax=Frateuria sp. Soil773 TaxID=1736407 RepID=UPI0006F834EE|nr:zinc-ribbon and DUF3426 domain-containing protein [Frateuria sp. Soil773]KRE96566.1 hypothetical protein ASG87_16370 [Frateuria sp. Soil773]